MAFRKDFNSFTKEKRNLADEKNGCNSDAKPEFEPVLYISYGTGKKYFAGFYLKSDVQNSTDKFQKLLKNYQGLILKVDCSKNNGPTAKVIIAFRNLINRGKKEKIKLYTKESAENYLRKYQREEQIKRDKWNAEQKQIEK